MEIKVEDVIRNAAPEFRLLAVEADVRNEATSDDLWREVESVVSNMRATMVREDINKRPGVKATREAYKKLGKDPNRYRPSQEQLSRRVLGGNGLYRLTSLVDVINILSMEFGHSIGGFDADKIVGDSLALGRGEAGEKYEGIGRGLLNIEGLPVYRDSIGGIGTPTSDEERTKLTEDTRRLLMIVNIYGEEVPEDKMKSRISELLERYAFAENIRFIEVSAKY